MHSSRAHSKRPRLRSRRSISSPSESSSRASSRRVLELLRGERAPVPLGEPLRPLQPHAEHLPDQRLVALLVAEPEEARGQLGVEDAGDLGGPDPAQDRDVLAARVHHDLDRRIGQHQGQRSGIGRVVSERVDHLGPHAVGRVRVGNCHLGKAQERLVAAFRHELRVDRDPAVGGRPLCQRGCHEAATILRETCPSSRQR